VFACLMGAVFMAVVLSTTNCSTPITIVTACSRMQATADLATAAARSSRSAMMLMHWSIALGSREGWQVRGLEFRVASRGGVQKRIHVDHQRERLTPRRKRPRRGLSARRQENLAK
jgi:hypothetical protein